MVCDSCAKKTNKLAVRDVWRADDFVAGGGGLGKDYDKKKKKKKKKKKDKAKAKADAAALGIDAATLGAISTPATAATQTSAKEERRKTSLATNTLLKKRSGDKKSRSYTPLTASCKSCGDNLHQMGSKYCQPCAYQKGKCSMCGKKILANVSQFKQSNT